MQGINAEFFANHDKKCFIFLPKFEHAGATHINSY